jgi:hypothetical protein
MAIQSVKPFEEHPAMTRDVSSSWWWASHLRTISRWQTPQAKPQRPHNDMLFRGAEIIAA